MPWMIEGEWLGYRRNQDRVVHRTFGHDKKFADRVMALGYGIRFSDGTTLRLYVKAYRGRPKAETINGYTSLIKDCAYAGVDSVDALYAKRKEDQSLTTKGQP